MGSGKGDRPADRPLTYQPRLVCEERLDDSLTIILDTQPGPHICVSVILLTSAIQFLFVQT